MLLSTRVQKRTRLKNERHADVKFRRLCFQFGSVVRRTNGRMPQQRNLFRCVTTAQGSAKRFGQQHFLLSRLVIVLTAYCFTSASGNMSQHQIGIQRIMVQSTTQSPWNGDSFFSGQKGTEHERRPNTQMDFGDGIDRRGMDVCRMRRRRRYSECQQSRFNGFHRAKCNS